MAGEQDPRKRPKRARHVAASFDPIASPDFGEGMPEPEYKVGKGRPPLHSRFQPGGPGGPGRPKGAKNRATLFREALDSPKPVRVGSSSRRMTSQQLAYLQLARQAAAGNLKAIALTEQIRNSLCGQEGAAEPVELPLSDAELAILGRRRRG